jgi:hypothetical protein
MEGMNDLLLAKKEIIYVAQISAESTCARRNGSCGPRRLSRGNVLMQLRDRWGQFCTDEAFADLFPTHGQPALAPWRLALVMVFQISTRRW